MTKKKIIHLSLGKANPNRANGVNKVIYELARTQKEEGLDVSFWGISFSKEHNYPERIFRTRLFMDSKWKFVIANELKKALAELNPEEVIFHLHGGFLPQLTVVARQLRKRNIPYIFTPHGAYNKKALEKSKWRKHGYHFLFEKTFVKGAKHVQLLGDSEYESYTNRFMTPASIIPNGQRLNHVDRKNRKDHQGLRLGFIGRIDIHTKGLDSLLEGLSFLTKEEKVILEIIGGGDELKSLVDLAKQLGVEDRIVFRGTVFGKKKWDAIKSWDALCLLSRNEGLPGVVLEAASVGVPSLVTKETNMAGYLLENKSGWVVQNRTPEMIIQEMQKILKAKQMGKWGHFSENAIIMIRNEFDWKTIVEKLAVLYAA